MTRDLCGGNHENFIQLWRTIEDTIELQFDPAGNVINLSTKTFSKDVFKLLNKNLNFAPMQKYFRKMNCFRKINGFYRKIKLKAYFEDQES